MNVDHGTIVFHGIEVPETLLRNQKLIYKDTCEHVHESPKRTMYRFCEVCGSKRFFLEYEYTDTYFNLKDSIVCGRVRDDEENVSIRWYIVMEWYDGDYKIHSNWLDTNSYKRDEFKVLMKKYGLWKLKRWGLYVIKDPIPLTNFYKNTQLKNPVYAEKAIDVDPNIMKIVEEAKSDLPVIKKKKKAKSTKKKKNSDSDSDSETVPKKENVAV